MPNSAKQSARNAGIAGQTHQRGLQGGQARGLADGVTVDAVGKPISGNVSVDERITLDLRVRVNRTTAAERLRLQVQAGRQTKRMFPASHKRPETIVPEEGVIRLPGTVSALMAVAEFL